MYTLYKISSVLKSTYPKSSKPPMLNFVVVVPRTIRKDQDCTCSHFSDKNNWVINMECHPKGILEVGELWARPLSQYEYG